MNISEICIKRPVFASVMSLLIIVLGIICYSRLEVRGIPNIEPPVVSVSAQYLGADAAYMEQNIAMPIEKILRTVKNVDYTSSKSQSGKSNITIVFKLSVDINDAMNDIRSKIAEESHGFPEAMKLPTVQKVDSNAQPSLYLTVTSDRHDDMALTELLNQTVIKELEKIDSVGAVKPFGGKYYNMRITPDPAAMYALKIAPLEIEKAVRAQNKDYPAGSINTDARQFTLRLGGGLKTVEDFENIILRSGSDGMVKLAQVAKVELAPSDDEGRIRYNGIKCIAMGLIKQSSSNILAMSKDVASRLAYMRSLLPAGVKLEIAYDASVPVAASIDSVYMTIFEALLLVILVVFLFLQSAKLTLIPFVTIPVSLIGTFSFMYALGFSINTFTLLAMILAIGLVVDDAIVMLENIFRHYNAQRERNGVAAAISGSREIGFAVVAMTITLAAVFLPVGFDDGMLGRMFIEFAWTLAFCVIVSGFVALTLTPMMAAKMVGGESGHPPDGGNDNRGGILGHFSLLMDRITEAYMHYLTYLMNHRKQFWALCASSILILILSVTFSNKAFMPAEDEGFLMIFFNGPEGSSTEHTDNAIKKAEQIIAQHRDVAGYFTAAWGGDEGFAFVPLKPWGERNKSAMQIQGELNKRFSAIPDVGIFAMAPGSGSWDQKPVEFQLSTNEEWDSLDKESSQVIKLMRESQIFTEIERDLKVSTPTLDIVVDRDKAYLYGVSLENIGITTQYLIAGKNLGNFRMNNETYDITMRYAEDDRNKVSDLSKVYIKSDKSQLLYLDSVANIAEKISIKSYNHYNGAKSVKISAALAEGVKIDQAFAFIEEWKERDMGDKLSLEYMSEIKQMNETGGNILFLFVLALVFIYLVLAAQFESWKDPFIILCAVPFSITGGVVALLLTGSSLNIYSDIGLVTLIGLVTKNSIMIVEFANQLREKGMSKIESVLEASRLRLRPILMTTLATIAGAVPLAFASGAGAGARNSIGVVVVGGMLLGTMFTLFVIPVLYKRFK